MPYKLLLKPGAEEDIENAFIWYEEQKIGLGEDFLKELASFYHKIEDNPTFFKKIAKSYRQVSLKTFPYVIVFEISGRSIIVYAVFHTSRNPKNKLRKT